MSKVLKIYKINDRPFFYHLFTDRISEVVMITNDHQLQVVQYNSSLHNARSKRLPQLEPVHAVHLPSLAEEDGKKPRPVAMDVGFLDAGHSMQVHALPP